MQREFEKQLPVAMEPNELEAATREFAAEYTRHQDLLEQKDKIYAAWRRRIKDSAGRVSHAHEVCNRGLRDVAVQVRETYDLEAGEAHMVRMDTGERLPSRPLTDDELEALAAERQIELAVDDAEDADDE